MTGRDVETSTNIQSAAGEASETTLAAGQDSSKRSRTSRRQLLRTGAVGAPVIASLLSRPAWGTGSFNGQCYVSGFDTLVSAGNMMGDSPGRTLTDGACSAYSPDYWQSDCHNSYSSYFQGTYIPRVHKYATYYQCWGSYDSQRLRDCLDGSNTLKKRATALYLNACSGYVPVSPADVPGLYDCARGHTLSFSYSGGSLDSDECRTYIDMFFS